MPWRVIGASIFITIIWELRRQAFLFGIPNAIAWRSYNVLISQWLWCKQYHENHTIVNATPLGYGMQDASYIVKDKDAISLVIANKHEDD